MLDVTLYTCPYCHKAFSAGDDVVFCPDCGAPHHRDCYRRHGRCAFAADHGTPAQFRPMPAKDSEDALVCGNCGTVNQQSDRFCSKCGHDLHEEFPPAPSEQQPPVDESVFYAQFSPYIGIASDSMMDGFPVMDIATFVGPNAGFYLSRFHFMNLQKNKSSWNWSAAICPFIWALYRKMYRLAAGLFVLELLLFLPYFGAFLYFVQGLSDRVPLDSLPAWLLVLCNLSAVLGFVLRTAMAILSNRVYHTYVLRRMETVRRVQGETPHYREELASSGGVTLVWPLAVSIGCAVLIPFATVIWLIVQ